MANIRLKIFSLLLIISLISQGLNAIELEKGFVKGDQLWKELTSVDYAAGYFPLAVVRSSNDSIVYVYDGAIGKTDLANNKALSGWSLKASKTCSEEDVDCVEPWWIGRWGNQEFLEPEIAERIINYDQNVRGFFDFKLSYGEDEIAEAVGCLEYKPLRYG